MRSQTNLDDHDPDECKDKPGEWGDDNENCPDPEFAGGGAKVRFLFKI